MSQGIAYLRRCLSLNSSMAGHLLTMECVLHFLAILVLVMTFRTIFLTFIIF